ncbi:MAG: hypothetical protein ACT4TC_04715 [Myxococcaceae bacterium]
MEEAGLGSSHPQLTQTLGMANLRLQQGRAEAQSVQAECRLAAARAQLLPSLGQGK